MSWWLGKYIRPGLFHWFRPLTCVIMCYENCKKAWIAWIIIEIY